MPRKRRASTSSLEEYPSEEKYMKDDIDSRAPRNAANARERARMRVLSKAFGRLKTSLPWVPSDTKLSKLDTLRLASTYIAHLRAVLRDDGEAHPETTKSLSLALNNMESRWIHSESRASSSQSSTLFMSVQVDRITPKTIYPPFATINSNRGHSLFQSNNATALMNNSCNVSSSTSSSCNQYRGQQATHDIQNFHHSGHQSVSTRHNLQGGEQQLSYF